MAYLYINKSDSHCECSGAGVDPYLLKCPHCGERWTHLSSDYAGSKYFEMTVRNMRPDLIPDFKFTDFYKSPEGQELIDEFLGVLDEQDD
jgi:hypothetical protein